MEDYLSAADWGRLVGKEPVTIRRCINRFGIRGVGKNPKMYLRSECISASKKKGWSWKTPADDSVGRESGNGSASPHLLSLKDLPKDQEALKVMKMGMEVLEKTEKIEKARRESGKLLKEEDVAAYLSGIVESIRVLAPSVEDGLVNAFDGKTPVQCAREVARRMERFLRELSELKWNELVNR